MAHTDIQFIDSHGDMKQLKRRFHPESTMRYKVKGINELLEKEYELLKKIIAHHKARQVPRIRELYDYARANNHTIANGTRRKETDMSDARAIHDFGGTISTFKQGYLTGIPIRVEYVDESTRDAATSNVDDQLDKIGVENDFYALNRNLVKDLSQVGRAYDVVYREKSDKTKIRRLDPEKAFVIYDMTLDEHSVAGVYYYPATQFGDDDTAEHIELYTDTHVHYLELKGEKITELKVSQKHSFGDVQITEYLNNTEGIGDYEKVLSIIDLYDAAQSDTANYMTDLSDAILAIFGTIDFPDGLSADEQIEHMRKMRQARLMIFEPPTTNDGAAAGDIDARYLVKEYDVAGTEAYKDRLQKNITQFTFTPDLTDEKFSGNSSGESLKYKLFGLELEGDNTQTLFKRCLQRRYELIATVGLIAQEISEFDKTKLKITFTPKLPKSLTETIENFEKLGGEISNETAMRITNIVEKPEAELENLANQSNKLSDFQRRLREAEKLTDAALNKDVTEYGQEENE